MRKPTAIIISAYWVTLKATICAVMVVPIFAPMMTPTDWVSVIKPAEIKPTTSTVVTDEELSTAVTKAPVSAPIKRFLVSRSSTSLSESPAAAFSPSDICSMPNKNMASPPNNPIPRLNQSIASPSGSVVASAGSAIAKRRKVPDSKIALERFKADMFVDNSRCFILYSISSRNTVLRIYRDFNKSSGRRWDYQLIQYALLLSEQMKV